MPAKDRTLTRDEKAENLVLNYSMIMMSIFEDVFANLASRMSEAMVAEAEAMSEALNAQTSGTKPNKGAGRVEAEVSDGVKKVFSEMRRNAAAEMSAGSDSFREYLKNPRFDEGIKIVESYEFGLRKLTEKLSDEDIASYLALLGKEDAKAGEMFRELSEWQKSIPKFDKGKQ